MTFSQFKEKYGIRLTDQQEKAVLRSDGYTLLLAVPGSGKTTVIVSRLGYMMQCLGIPHDSILTLTYSVASCRDMKERYISMFGTENVPQFRTINGICALIVMEYEKVMGKVGFKLIEGETSENDILTEIYKRTYGKMPDTGGINELKRHMGYARNMMISDSDADNVSDDGKLGTILSEYRKYKKKMRIMDYDDQLEFAYIILRKYPEILKIFRRRFRYINVDEAQDTSKLQHEIIALLTDKNLFMVGDEDQSIYGFRAAYPNALMEFDKRFPDASVLLMERNFRSTKKIIKRASMLISNNTERRSKNMYTENESGSDIDIINFSVYPEQFVYLKDICFRAQNASETTAILFRNNESAVPLADILDRLDIQYRLTACDGMYFSNPAVTDMMTMLAYCENPDDGELFVQLAPRLGCGLTKKAAMYICEYARINNLTVYRAFKEYIRTNTNKALAAQSLFREIENYGRRTIAETILHLHTDTCFGRFLDHRVKDKLKIGVLFEIAKKCDSRTTLVNRLQYLYELVTKGRYSDNPCVLLSTMHSSKGLEFDNVIIMDVKDGTLPGEPQSRSELKNIKQFLEEERRLFYVAVTRAKKSVTLLKYHSEYNRTRAEGSSFIRELMSTKTSIHDVQTPKVHGASAAKSKTEIDTSLFVPGAYVNHRIFGNGRIVSTEEDKCTVVFENKARKSFLLGLCIESGIMEVIKDKRL